MPDQPMPAVLPTTNEPRGLPADYVDAIDRKTRSTIPDPRLPAFRQAGSLERRIMLPSLDRVKRPAARWTHKGPSGFFHWVLAANSLIVKLRTSLRFDLKHTLGLGRCRIYGMVYLSD